MYEASAERESGASQIPRITATPMTPHSISDGVRSGDTPPIATEGTNPAVEAKAEIPSKPSPSAPG